MAENKHIPSDLHPAILEKLPSKSLLKFLTVSESWYSVIKNPKFIASHLHHHKSLSRHPNNQLLLLRCHKPSLTYYLYRYDNPIPRRTKLRNPLEEFGCVVASYDGLVCLSGKMGNLMLWNPSIDKFRCIEPAPYMHTHECVVGFGYNSLKDNYKLILINYHSMSIDGMYSAPTNPPCAHVYSVNREGEGEGMSLGWNEVLLPEFFPFHYNLSRISECCFVNGMIHWIVFRGEFDDAFLIKEVGALIMTFDPESDCFGEIKLPTVISETVDPLFELAVIGGSLAVVQLPGNEKPMDNVVVWRMEEYGVDESWKVLYRIKLSSATNKKVWAKEDGKVIITTSSGTMIVFNVNSVNNSGVFDGARGMRGGKAYGCTESLALLDL